MMVKSRRPRSFVSYLGVERLPWLDLATEVLGDGGTRGASAGAEEDILEATGEWVRREGY